MTRSMGTRRGTANLPLHGGKAPAWLFRRMVELAGAVTIVITREFGPQEMLKRLSDPFWFQAFGCVLGFDWHSSGVTTTVCGALKEAAKKYGSEMGIVVCGGKGGASRKTPIEIASACDRSGDDGDQLVYASRMSAKVDSAAVQDGYQLYQHTFFFIPGSLAVSTATNKVAVNDPAWCVVQQGLNDARGYARRYHWASNEVESFVDDPHAAIASEARGATLNLVAGEANQNRERAVELSRFHPDKLLREIRPLLKQKQLPLFDRVEMEPSTPTGEIPPGLAGLPDLTLPSRHTLNEADLSPKQLYKVVTETYESPPADFAALLARPGVGPQTMRSLTLLAEVIFNAPASRRDPATYSFAHGGKDGFPFPVTRDLYDENIQRLREAVNASKLGQTEKMDALERLARWLDPSPNGSGVRLL